MTLRSALIAFCCSLPFVVGVAQAKDQDGAFAVKGVGALECGRFVAAASANSPQLVNYAGYATGYVSAFNELSAETFEVLPWQNMNTFILLTLQRCRQAPEKKFGVAVSEVTRYFGRNSLSQASEKIRLTAGGTTVELYQPVVAQIEQALVARGYPAGDTAASLSRFQNEHKISGRHPFDQLVLLKLLYGKQEPSPKE